MLTIFLVVMAYVFIGMLFDLFVHNTHPIMYWSATDALFSHLQMIALWPLILVLYVIHRFR